MKYTKALKTTYSKVLKPILFCFDAELVHNFFTFLGHYLGKNDVLKNITKKTFRFGDDRLSQKLFNLDFQNPVGLAAGFDYNGKLVCISDAVGFGFESLGTVTFSPYQGNRKPRLGRLPKSKSLLVNKGFKSNGIAKILDDLNKQKHITQTIGISIGATNSSNCATANAQMEDIVKSFTYLKSHKVLNKFQFLELNISCPNVLGSGSLANKDSLLKVLNGINELQIKKPLFVKFPLEIEWSDAKELIQILIDQQVSAIIIANLLKKRNPKYFSDNELSQFENKPGNFSGKPTFDQSNELISKVYKEFGDKIKIIGVGGIFNARDAYEKIKRGACLIQLITGMIFEGPQLIGEINSGLVKLLDNDGYEDLSEAIGTKSN